MDINENYKAREQENCESSEQQDDSVDENVPHTSNSCDTVRDASLDESAEIVKEQSPNISNKSCDTVEDVKLDESPEVVKNKSPNTSNESQEEAFKPDEQLEIAKDKSDTHHEAADTSSEGCLEIDLDEDELDSMIVDQNERALVSKDKQPQENEEKVQHEDDENELQESETYIVEALSSSEDESSTREYLVEAKDCDDVLRSNTPCSSDLVALEKVPDIAESPPLPTLLPLPGSMPNKSSDLFRLLTTSTSAAQRNENDIPMRELQPIPENQLNSSTFAPIQDDNMRDDIEQFLGTPEPFKPTSADLFLDSSVSKPTSANSSISSNDGKFKIVDSLLDKIRRKNSDSSGSEILSKVHQRFSEEEEDLLVEIEAPVKFKKFGNNPQLMSTPVITNQRFTSAFTNSEEEYNRTVAKHKPVKRHIVQEDKSQMGSKSEPPRMRAPDVPSNHQRPRTLAEKRQLVNNRNVKMLMVEQESRIYKQVQRKNHKMEINYNLLDSMMREDVPINHGPWKVLTWLRTREGAYIHQSLNLDGAEYKLIGSRGNHAVKYLPPQSSKPLEKYQTTTLRSTRCCIGGRIKKRVAEALMNMPSIKRFVLDDTTDQYKRLETKFLDNQLVSIKPRPLARKIEFINKNRKLLSGDEDSAFLGDYLKFEMPNINIELETVPRAPIDPTAKKYLREILPYRDLDENWCEFALSALATNDETKTFKFMVPYQDNKQNILVRKIIRCKEDTEKLRIPVYEDGEDDVDEMEWTFAENANKDDPVEVEVIEIIKDLTNSVFINLNDDLFTLVDSYDRKISSDISPIKTKEAIDELSTIVKPDQSAKRVMKELKRLNANVYKPESQCVEDVS